MKALSVRQPWAWLIVNGFKDVENRTWRTNFRGQFLIHAGLKLDVGGYVYAMGSKKLRQVLPSKDAFLRGGIVGTATLVNCVAESDSPWFFGPYGFVLAGAHRVEFVPVRGQLRFFDVDDGLVNL